MSEVKMLSKTEAKDYKPIAKGGSKLISDIKSTCFNYAMGGFSVATTALNLSNGSTKMAAVTAAAATVYFLAAHFTRKEIQAKMKEDYKGR